MTEQVQPDATPFTAPGVRAMKACPEPAEPSASEARFRTLFELAPDPIYLNDLQGTFIDGNQAAEILSGYSREELVGKSWLSLSLLSPTDLTRAARNLGRLARGEPTGPEEYVLHCKDGRQVPVEIRAFPLTIGSKPVVLGIARDVSERKRAESALRERERQLATLMSNLPGMAYRCRNDSLWTMEFVSDGAFDLTGYAASDLVGNRVVAYSALIHPEDRESVRRQVLAALKKREPFVLIYRIISATGAQRWVWEQGRGILNEQGNFEALEGFVADITERKQSEEKLRRSETRFRCVSNVLQYRARDLRDLLEFALREAITLSSSKHGYLCVYDEEQQRFTLCAFSEQAMEHCVVGPRLNACSLDAPTLAAEVVRQREPLVLNDLQSLSALNQGMTEGRLALHRFMSIPVLHADRIVAVAGLANKEGEYDGLDVVQVRLLMDTVWKVVLKREADEALAVSEERFRRAVVDSPFPTMLHAEDGAVLQVSNSWCEITGYNREELPTTVAWTRLAYGADAEDVQVGVNRLYMLDHRVYERDFAVRTRSGETRIWEFSSAPLGSLPDGRRMVISVANDVTERRRLEQQRVTMEAQLRQQQKLESIGTLAGGVAHEINNPINGILNYAQLIQDRLPPDSSLREFTGEILRETQRVATIVRNLLTFARDDKQSHSLASLADIVQSALPLISTVFRRDQITLELDVPADLPRFRCRSQQLQQVLMNLLTNARDALNERYPGNHPDKLLRLYARLCGSEGARWLRVTVEDHGIGIAPELRERVFDPFFTTKPRDRGTGLGLSISHGIVTDHGGKLWFESDPGSGTRFHVDLPLNVSSGISAGAEVDWAGPCSSFVPGS